MGTPHRFKRVRVTLRRGGGSEGGLGMGTPRRFERVRVTLRGGGGAREGWVWERPVDSNESESP